MRTLPHSTRGRRVLLWTSVAHPACRRATKGTTVASWSNWAGNQTGSPQAVETPRDVEEVALLVKRAASNGQRVKAVGSGHSFTATAVTDGIVRSEEHTSELQSHVNLVCRLLLEK